MVIETTAYRFTANEKAIFRFPIVLKNRQILPNKHKGELPQVDSYTVSKKTDYEFRILDKYDIEFKPNHIYGIDYVGYTGNITFCYIKLTVWQELQMRIFWSPFFKPDNIISFVTRTGSVLTAALLIWLVAKAWAYCWH